jgi:hypothetical protein
MSAGGFSPLPDDARGLSGYSVHPAEWRLAQFLWQPNLADVAAGFGELVRASDGSGTVIQLAQLAMYRADDRMSRDSYWSAVRNLAATTTIPLSLFLSMAQYQLELTRSVLAAYQRIPFNPVVWDAEWNAAGESA